VTARDDIFSRIATALADVPADERPDDVRVPRDYVRSHVTGDVVDLFVERVEDYRATVVRVGPTSVRAEIARALATVGSVVVPAGFPADWLPAGAVSRNDAETAGSSISGAHASTAHASTAHASTAQSTTHTPAGAGASAASYHSALTDEGRVVGVGRDTAERDAAGGSRWLSDDPVLATDALDRVGAALTTAALGIALTGTIVLDAGAGQGRRALTLVPDMHVCVIRAEQITPDVPDALARLDATRPLTFISGPSATSDIELERVEGVHGPRNLYVIVVEKGLS